MRRTLCVGVMVILWALAAVGQTAPAQRAWAAMVTIRGNRASGQKVTGAGFVAAPNGTIVSNLHLIKGLSNVSVELGNGDVFDAPTLVSSDERRDLAILRIPGFDLPYVQLGNSNQLQTGDGVMLVTAARQPIATGTVLGMLSADGLHLIQVSFPSNAADNGGLLINANGQAVGVLGFPGPRESSAVAVPINYARGMMEGAAMAEEQTSAVAHGDVRRPPLAGSVHPAEADRGTANVAQSPSTVGTGFGQSQPRAAVPQKSAAAPAPPPRSAVTQPAPAPAPPPAETAKAAPPSRPAPEYRRAAPGVHRIFVESLGEGEGADLLRDKIVHSLTQQRFVVVNSAESADAVLSGSGTWSHLRIKSLRARLVSGDQRVLWSGEVSAGGWVKSASSSIADKLVEKMMDALANQ